MRSLKPECANCGSKRKVKKYMSDKNLLKIPLKTHYCANCAKHILVGQEPIQEGA